MKELSIEEKARRYDEVKNKLSRFIAQGVDPLITRADVQDFFPELKESEEDEKIRKALLEYFSHYGSTHYQSVQVADILTWLEKQDEQKPADKVEPKFHEGQWINGGIVCEDFNDGDGYYKVNLAYLSKSQVELIENLVASWQTSANNSVKWSEEDEKMVNNILTPLAARYPFNIYQPMYNWLKSLKQRIGG